MIDRNFLKSEAGSSDLDPRTVASTEIHKAIRSVPEKFEDCRNIGDIFELVREAAERYLGKRRVGLTLYLADLPTYIGAFYPVGSNTIVMNRVLLDAVNSRAESKEEEYAFVYMILLHEYLHSLGYYDEATVRRLVFEVTKFSFGPNHKTFELAMKGPSALFSLNSRTIKKKGSNSIEVVRDFDRSSFGYIG